jgi:branched-chain amino acid transport system substrate-binding protein
VQKVEFFPGEQRPGVQAFVNAYEKRYHTAPDEFAAGAYDALKILAWATEKGGADRVAIQKALVAGKNIPSVMYGPFQFDSIRRVSNVKQVPLTIKNGQFVLFNSQAD